MSSLTSTDQLGNAIQLPFPPKRIVSLVPSQTEFLFDIGLDNEVKGITRFCIHPKEKVKSKTVIGGTKQFDIEKIKSLKPDLIIGNKEENYLEGIEVLSKYFPVWMSDIYTLEDACSMMSEVSRITNREIEGRSIVHQIQKDFSELNQSDFSGKSCAYFIWRKPYMAAASNTFIDDMLSRIGLKNVYGHLNRYPEILPHEMATLKPDYIFLSSEPYSFSEKHFDEFKEFCPSSKVMVVDGEIFSWYGSRLLKVREYFRSLTLLV
jgi:ABC-type Fe3+-hydroxamate transport system substrate-binding protein